jgi:hypothetical protein
VPPKITTPPVPCEPHSTLSGVMSYMARKIMSATRTDIS